MVHLHARTPDSTHRTDRGLPAITEAIRAESSDGLIINSDGDLGVPMETRIAYLRELRPEVARWTWLDELREVFVAAQGLRVQGRLRGSFDTIGALLSAMVDAGVRPEHECFDSGHVVAGSAAGHQGVDAAAAGVVRDGVVGGSTDGAQRRAVAEQVPDMPHRWA